jgi:hypothetical protein
MGVIGTAPGRVPTGFGADARTHSNGFHL